MRVQHHGIICTPCPCRHDNDSCSLWHKPLIIILFYFLDTYTALILPYPFPTFPKAQEDWGLLIQDAENRGTIIKATESNFGMVTHKVLKLVFPARRSSYPPNPPVSTYSERERDHRMPVRPSDPRQLPATHALTHGASDPRCRQNSTRSFHSPSERRQERQSFSSSRTQRM